MSEPYEIASLLPLGLDAWRAVSICDRVLREAGMRFDEDSQLLLNDTETDEPEPRSVHDPSAALWTLAHWPTLGAIEYAAPEGPATASFLTESYPPLVHCAIVSALQRAVDNSAGVVRYQVLAGALHQALGASRTVMAWGLTAGGFNWRSQLAQLRRGIYDSAYELVDLRQTPEP